MRVHSNKKLLQLRSLRRRGYSINEICDLLQIPKTTVWHHVRKVKVRPEYVQLLKSKQGGGLNKTKKKWQQARLLAQRLLASKDRELSIAAAVLYWAEGSKNSPDFVNSDANMIRLYLTFVRRVLRVSDDWLRVTVRLVSGMNEKDCMKYWSTVTNIPISNMKLFINDGGSKSRTKYGMCRVVIGKGCANVLKLMHSLIGLYASELLKGRFLGPRSSTDRIGTS